MCFLPICSTLEKCLKRARPSGEAAQSFGQVSITVIWTRSEHRSSWWPTPTCKNGRDRVTRDLLGRTPSGLFLVEQSHRGRSREEEISPVKEGVVLSRESRSSEKFMHGIKVLMAKNYIDNSSEEARKGMQEKAEQGIWPTVAPLGYRNAGRSDGKRIIEPDPDSAPSLSVCSSGTRLAPYPSRRRQKMPKKSWSCCSPVRPCPSSRIINFR